jgi:hypothetical protein
VFSIAQAKDEQAFLTQEITSLNLQLQTLNQE